MCITEYNEEETMQMFKEEGRAEILKELRELGIDLDELRARKRALENARPENAAL